MTMFSACSNHYYCCLFYNKISFLGTRENSMLREAFSLTSKARLGAFAYLRYNSRPLVPHTAITTHQSKSQMYPASPPVFSNSGPFMSLLVGELELKEKRPFKVCSSRGFKGGFSLSTNMLQSGISEPG